MARIERTTDVTRTPGSPEGVVGPGLIAGLVAAVVMGLIASIVATVNGLGFWTPMMLIGATFLGADWLSVPVWAALLGVGTHLFIGAAFGVLFTALTRNLRTTGAMLAAGLTYGAAIYLFMTFLVMPWADPVMYLGINEGLFFLYHLAYGATLPLALPVRFRGAVTGRRREAY